MTLRKSWLLAGVGLGCWVGCGQPADGTADDVGTGGTEGPSGGADASGGAGGRTSGGSASGGSATTGGRDGVVLGSGGALGGGGAGGEAPVALPSLVTSAKGAFWETAELAEGTGTKVVTVDAATKYQKWKGFGGTFNERGWDALLALSDELRAQVISKLFSTTDGLGLDWGRIPIGASDYAMDRYTCDDTPSDLSDFSIDRDREKLIPYIQAAQAVKDDIQFWGSPWTPPPWMKDNGEYDRGSMISTDANLSLYAEYLRKWVDAFEGEGIDINHIHPQNEPGWQQDYPSCAWGPSDKTTGAPFLGDFVENYLLEQFTDGAADVWYGTLSNDSTFEEYWGNLSEAARGKIKGVGLQWGTMARAEIVRQENPNLLIMQSEHKCGNYPWLSAKASSPETANENNFLASTAPNNQAYGEESWKLLRDWIKADVNIYSAWNMVLDTDGFSMDEVRPWPQNALIAVDRTEKTAILTPAYFVFRHVAHFVRPDADRIDISATDALAFQNPDGSLVAVLYNGGSSDSSVALEMGGKTYGLSVPSHGWATAFVAP